MSLIPPTNSRTPGEMPGLDEQMNFWSDHKPQCELCGCPYPGDHVSGCPAIMLEPIRRDISKVAQNLVDLAIVVKEMNDALHKVTNIVLEHSEQIQHVSRPPKDERTNLP